jgi:hypothetical protein
MLCLRGDMYPILLDSSCAFWDDFILFLHTNLQCPYFYLYRMLYLTVKLSGSQRLILHGQMIIFSVQKNSSSVIERNI